MASQTPGGDDYGRLIHLPERPSLKGGGGGGTFDPMERVWEKLGEHDKRFDKTEAKLDKLIETVSELKGRMSASPTTWQLLGIVITTWAAGAAIVFALTRFVR